MYPAFRSGLWPSLHVELFREHNNIAWKAKIGIALGNAQGYNVHQIAVWRTATKTSLEVIYVTIPVKYLDSYYFTKIRCTLRWKIFVGLVFVAVLQTAIFYISQPWALPRAILILALQAMFYRGSYLCCHIPHIPVEPLALLAYGAPPLLPSWKRFMLEFVFNQK